MPEPFSITRAMYRELPPADLHEEIQSKTGSNTATTGIMRSMERFGTDESILHYEMIPVQSARSRHSAPVDNWTVRAVRPTKEL